ncbi:MAG: hypothetical protein ABI594_03335 [Ginsengibacter sp.]
MEQAGHISIIITGKTVDGNLNPRDIDIDETKELLNEVETLLFPSKTEKSERPKVTYEVKEGSVKNIFYIPLAKVIMFSALMTEVGNQGVLDLLDPKAATIIDKWQRKAQETGRQYEIHSSIVEGKSLLTINQDSQFIAPQSDWVNTSLYLYGEIYEEGGLSNINLHMLTDRYGKVLVKATKEQLVDGDNKLFKIYGLWVKGKQNLGTGQLKDLELIDYLKYQPEYEEIALQRLIKKASASWKSVKDKDTWLADVRGGANE